MIEWSYDLLSEPERALLRQLAVFIGDWTLEAAEAVCAEPGSGAGEVMDLLLRLVDKSLVTPQEQGGQVRYRMLETIGEFARRSGCRNRRRTRLREQHIEYF
jgi:predicted ATPase